MVVETRSQSKKLKVMEGQDTQPVVDGNPRTRSHSFVESNISAGSVSGTSRSKSVNSAILILEANYAKKLAEMERAALLREREVMERERAAMHLQMQAQIAALEEETKGSRRTRKSTLSSKDVRNWLDKCFQSSVVSCNLEDPNPDQKVAGVTPYQLTSIPLQRSEIGVGDNRVSTNISSKNNDYFVTTEPVSHPISADGKVDKNVSYTSPSRLIPGVTTNILKHDSLTKNNNLSDIQLLAEAIASLAGTNVPKNKYGNVCLPIFDGKALDWLTFNRVFEDTKIYFSASENISRINIALQGAAREAVSVLLVSAREPNVLIEALERRFGRPEFIILQETASIRALPRISSDGSDLNKFVCRVRNCVEVIKLLNQKSYLESPEIYQCILNKLTPLLRTRWLDYADANYVCGGGTTKLEHLSCFLAREVDLRLQFGAIMYTSVPTKPFDKLHTVSYDNNFPSGHVSCKPVGSSNSLSNNNTTCLFCEKNHGLNCCEKFKALTIPDKWLFVREKKLCHKCLKRGFHNYKKCKVSKEVCKVKNCKFKHHSLLHDSSVVTHISDNIEDIEPGTSGNSPQTISEVVDSGSLDIVAHFTSSSYFNSRPMLKMIAVTVAGPSASVDTYALLDDGSTATFIDADLVSEIGAKGPVSKIQLNCVGGLSKETQVEYVNFNVKGRHNNFIHSVKRARSIKNLNLGRQSAVYNKITKFPHLVDLASELCYDNIQPKIILGIDNWDLTFPQAIRKGTKHQPVAIKTALGWVLFGSSSSRTKPVELVNHSLNIGSIDSDYSDNLENLIKEQYKLDSVGITKRELLSAENQRAIDILERTSNRLPDGRFEIGLLWKSDNPVVPDSYALALSRFLSLERKMVRDPSYAERYKLNIDDMLAKGYAEKCDHEPRSNSVCWYLPHFGVTNPNKPNKLRVVHDAAAKINDVSLNSLLISGPDLLQSLFDILIRFREGKVAMIADIKEMFPRFKIIERDRDAQRFLWRNSPNEPLGTYRMSSMIFGAVSSPFTAMYIKNKNALEVKDLFPQAVHSIMIDVYMDDYVGSVNSTDEAASLALDIVNINARAGLQMRGWISNHPVALKSLPVELVDQNGMSGVSSFTRVLGLIWQPLFDTIGFNNISFNNNEKLPIKITKRVILSFLMRVFDPLGILAPVVISGRIIFQNVWRMNLGWDVELPQSVVTVWSEWLNDLITTSQLTIPRCYSLHEVDPLSIELHMFADASEQAYTAVAYFRFIFPDERVKLSLVCSKSRVAPLKPSSIPRLELQAALIAARLASTVVEATRYKIARRIFWCDSMNVLGWLRNDARCYKPFVAHRVGEIIELTNISEWRWVSTVLNVADDATRLKRGPLKLDSRWLNGPDFLLTSNWPTEPLVTRPSVELKLAVKVHTHLILEANSSMPLSADATRFSTWIRLLHATAQAHRYLALLRLRAMKKKGHCVDYSCRVAYFIFNFRPSTMVASQPCLRSAPTPDDLRLAEIHILRQSQIDSFSGEINCIRNGKPVSQRSRLLKLPGVIDETGLLRLSSRITATREIEESMKFPILLDGKHHAVRLLVLHYHRKFAHANNETIVNELRQIYWILSLRNTVRAVARNCQFCQVRRSTTFQPTMGDLPEARLAHHHRPFSFVGLDYFGPITIAVGRRTEKRYVALYTCLTVRAIHLEIVHSLSTDAAIMALRRFVARRGTPNEIYSDNGTAFVGANRQLKILYGDAIAEYSNAEVIKWKFIPPSAPFMGGAWERLVKSVKAALRVSLRDKTPSEEVLTTLLCEAESIVNSRPLTHISTNFEDEEALTPFHFILGSSSGRPIPATLSASDICSRVGWRKALLMADVFWHRWIREYLPTLSPRRVAGNIPTLNVGDIVIIADGNLPRASWPKGRVSAVFPGKDGVIRVADICTNAGVLRRPLKKLVRLPV